MNLEDIKSINIPDEPGVYVFKKGRDVLYIGKATSLKDRVRSYFIGDSRSKLIGSMSLETDKVDWFETDSVLEALILEVSADNGWDLGIDWQAGNENGDFLFGGSSINNASRDFSSASSLPLALGFQVGAMSSGASAAAIGFALLNVSASDNKFNIISTPQVLTIDNEEAEINVGEEIPVPTGTRLTDTSSTSFTSFDYKSVGVKLKITPHITKHEKITLDLYQEVNSVLGETSILAGNIVPPKLGKRDIRTKVTVENGKTIVVGGLIRNDKRVVETKVPILGDIPLLGWLFKKKSVTYEKVNLMIFLTPYIVTKQKDIDALTRQKRNEFNKMKK